MTFDDFNKQLNPEDAGRNEGAEAKAATPPERGSADVWADNDVGAAASAPQTPDSAGPAQRGEAGHADTSAAEPTTLRDGASPAGAAPLWSADAAAAEPQQLSQTGAAPRGAAAWPAVEPQATPETVDSSPYATYQPSPAVEPPQRFDAPPPPAAHDAEAAHYAPPGATHGVETPHYAPPGAYSAEFIAPPGVHYAAPERPRRQRRAGRRIIAAILVLAMLGGAFGIFANFYQIVPQDGGFAVLRRDIAPDNQLYQPPLNNGSAAPKQSSTVSGAGEDAPSLTILGTAAVAGALTVAQIAEKCTPVTVYISALSDSFYYGTSASAGSGIIMTEDGYIITNNHVVEGATSLSVTLYDGREYEATLIGNDSRSDLAVLKIEATGLPFAEFGDSDAMAVGDEVVAIGNPLGKDFIGSVTNGIISGINRDVVVEERSMTLLQTNAAINSGNSGGPLINQFGQVIGITNMKMQSMSSVVEGLGFAIPTNTAKAIIDELIQHGYVKGYPSIGINYDIVSERMSQANNVPMGIIVGYVNPNANAYTAGLQVNDIIFSAMGETVTSAKELSAIKDQYKAGDEFTIRVYRYATKTEHDITFILNDEHDLVIDSTRLVP